MITKKKKLPKNIVVKGDTWFARKTVTVNGSRRQIWRACRSKERKDVLAALLEVENEIIRINSEPIPQPVPEISKTSFCSIAGLFIKIELQPAVYRNGKKVAGKKSAKNLLPKVRTAIGYFGEKEVELITFSDLQDFKLLRLETPIQFKTKTRQRSIRSVNYELQVVRQILNFAVRERKLNRNPFLDGKGLIVPSAENKRFVKLSKDEESKLFNLIEANYAYLRVLSTLFLDAGLRYSEAINLRWQQIDFTANQITLFGNETKNEKERSIPMTRRVATELRSYKKQTSAENVFNVRDVKRSWGTLRSKINRPDLRMHDLRHVFGTRLDEKGVSIPVISKLLGHASWKTTQIYVNPATNSLKEAISKLD